MAELDALIRACKDEPDDDAPRLILADWLEESGVEERAAFIRRQIESPDATAEELPPNPEWFGDWRREWPRSRDEGLRVRPHCYRGLIRIDDAFTSLFEHLDIILQPSFDWTWVEGIRFGSWHDGDWTPLFQSPKLLELVGLEFSGDWNHPRLAAPLAESPFVVNLRHLLLYDLELDTDGAKRLLQSPKLKNLRSLELVSTDIGRRAARAFATSDVWDNLHSCSFRRNHFGDSALSELAQGRQRPRLEHLDISHGQYGDRGLFELARSNCFPNLKELRIGYSTIFDGITTSFGTFGIESLVNSPYGGPKQLIVEIVSRDPVPQDISEVVNAYGGQIVLEYDQWLHARVW